MPNTYEIEVRDLCPYCDMAKVALTKAGVSWTIKDTDPYAGVTFPRVWKNGEYIGGFLQLEKDLANDR